MENQILTTQLDQRIITLWVDSLDPLHKEALKPCEILLDTYKLRNSLGVLLQYRTFRIECFSEALRNALMIGYRYYAIKAHSFGYDLCFSVKGEWSIAYNGAAIAKKSRHDESY
jgi:hypothetical protein